MQKTRVWRNRKHKMTRTEHQLNESLARCNQGIFHEWTRIIMKIIRIKVTYQLAYTLECHEKAIDQ